MANESILVERSGAVLTIVLNRPDKLNAFTEEMSDRLKDALCAAADADIRPVLLTGSGKCFCTGQDLGLIKQALHLSAGHSMEQQLTVESALQQRAGGTSDYAEGVPAFMEKRPAQFTGRPT